jgi:hypothetical protein
MNSLCLKIGICDLEFPFAEQKAMGMIGLDRSSFQNMRFEYPEISLNF